MTYGRKTVPHVLQCVPYTKHHRRIVWWAFEKRIIIIIYTRINVYHGTITIRRAQVKYLVQRISPLMNITLLYYMSTNFRHDR